MKTIKKSVASAAVVLGMLGLSVPWCGAAIPGGLLTHDVTDSANLLWDVTKVSDLHNIHVGIGDISADIYFDVDFTQDGAGKLKGAGVTTVEVISSESRQGSMWSLLMNQVLVTWRPGSRILHLQDE